MECQKQLFPGDLRGIFEEALINELEERIEKTYEKQMKIKDVCQICEIKINFEENSKDYYKLNACNHIFHSECIFSCFTDKNLNLDLVCPILNCQLELTSDERQNIIEGIGLKGINETATESIVMGLCKICDKYVNENEKYIELSNCKHLLHFLCKQKFYSL